MDIIKDELNEIKERYGDKRRTLVVHSDDDITLGRYDCRMKRW
jgi:DNA gyrase/topoisomerase IV subunit A